MDTNSNPEPDFSLEPYHRNVPDSALLDDLRRVADIIGKPKVPSIMVRGPHGLRSQSDRRAVRFLDVKNGWPMPEGVD
jgi:hypothetical protein